MDVSTLQQRFSGISILVVGDLMLDRYLWGNVTRISPEAPVPIVDVSQEESRPGGAANVALNVHALGAKVTMCGAVGDDKAGDELISLVKQAGFDHSLIQVLPGRPTTTKTRVIGNNQQMLRVDRETRESVSDGVVDALLEKLRPQLKQFDAIIFEDYDKGFLGPKLIQSLTAMATQAGIPTIVDPKFKNFLHYGGVTVFKPNMKELNEALGLRVSKADQVGILAAVKNLREKMPHENTLITLSEHGVMLVDGEFGYQHFPAHFRKITDVSGAGDTVVATLACCMAAGMTLGQASQAANLAGGLVCEEVGVVPVDLTRFLEELAQISL